jgi:hypothetical protein
MDVSSQLAAVQKMEQASNNRQGATTALSTNFFTVGPSLNSGRFADDLGTLSIMRLNVISFNHNAVTPHYDFGDGRLATLALLTLTTLSRWVTCPTHLSIIG